MTRTTQHVLMGYPPPLSSEPSRQPNGRDSVAKSAKALTQCSKLILQVFDHPAAVLDQAFFHFDLRLKRFDLGLKLFGFTVCLYSNHCLSRPSVIDPRDRSRGHHKPRFSRAVLVEHLLPNLPLFYELGLFVNSLLQSLLGIVPGGTLPRNLAHYPFLFLCTWRSTQTFRIAIVCGAVADIPMEIPIAPPKADTILAPEPPRARQHGPRAVVVVPGQHIPFATRELEPVTV